MHLTVCLLSLILWLSLSVSHDRAQAAAIGLNPVADALVSSANPSNNYGAAGALETSAAGLLRGEFQSVMKFDLAPAKTSLDSTFGVGQWQIQSATLQLTTAAPNNSLFNTNVAGQFSASWMQNDAWAEGTGTPAAPTSDGVTFATLPTFLSGADESLGTFNFPGGTSGANLYSLSLTSSFTSDLVAGNNVGFRLFAADSAMSYLVNSRNFPTQSARPLLTIEAVAVPEPAGAALVATLALLTGARRGVR